MCKVAAAIRHRLIHSYSDPLNPTPGLIDHLCMSAAEGAVEALSACGLSDGQFRQASLAEEVECATHQPDAAQADALAQAFFDLEVIQDGDLPDDLTVFVPEPWLRAACEQLAEQGCLMAHGDGFSWPLERLSVFRGRFRSAGDASGGT